MRMFICYIYLELFTGVIQRQEVVTEDWLVQVGCLCWGLAKALTTIGVIKDEGHGEEKMPDCFTHDFTSGQLFVTFYYFMYLV